MTVPAQSLAGPPAKPQTERAQVWLREGLSILAESGVESLTIEELCRRLNRTKGAFYHHFPHRQGYVDALLLYWERKMTQDLIDLSSVEDDPLRRLHRLGAAIAERATPSLEVAIRAWAMRDPAIHPYQERVDALRLAYLRDIFTALLGDAAEGRTRASITYAVLVGGYHIMPPITGRHLTSLFAHLERLYQPDNHAKNQESRGAGQ
ncbi:MAG TPA: TetR/AcrR family transcriptional regulator [Ktedonobacterales bacterium]|nr:TetR/AcrR family transcriptional regulator [Ktedonobacterales bacterium]